MCPENDEISELRKRVERLEGRMDFLFRSLGINEEQAPAWKPSPRVLDLLRRGKKVEAIKALREESGASLKDAKNFIEGLKDKYR
jgi:ribosomal protein L7/L12